MKIAILLSTWLIICYCQNIEILFEDINKQFKEFYSKEAIETWMDSVDPKNADLDVNTEKSTEENMLIWKDSTCKMLAALNRQHLLNKIQRRQMYLLCRGAKYTYEERRISSIPKNIMEYIYSDIGTCTQNMTKRNHESSVIEDFLMKTDASPFAAKMARNFNLENGTFCLKGEEDFEKAMKSTKDAKVLEWLWLFWRERTGMMKGPFIDFVRLENRAARRNGYTDIGAVWRDELEIKNLRKFSRELYNSIRPFYTMLHGVVRYYLRGKYGNVVPEKGPIPAHLLGDLWSQSWDTLIDLMTPKTIDLDASIKKLNWTVQHMVKHAEDFYQSMGLPAMTPKFWQESVFANTNGFTSCHGTAMDMFQDGDVRLLYCADTSMEDFYVLHHELGHIHYFMAYAHQPSLFRQANSAFHESIGDAIFNGVMTPQHLHRIGLINDSILYSDSTTKPPEQKSEDAMETNKYQPEMLDLTTNELLLLMQALNKIPHIPFGLVIDEYRWKYFEGGMDMKYLNREFWELTYELQGIVPPKYRGEEYFDVAAKYHVPDNTPYIRYFLTSFIQHQIFEALCRTAVFGSRDMETPLPDTIKVNRCDIYGSKAAGKLLKDFMSRGNSQSWQEILLSTTGNTNITSLALQRYYSPLYNVLERTVKKLKIPLGW